MKSLNCCFRDLLTFFLPNDAYQHWLVLLYKETWIFVLSFLLGILVGCAVSWLELWRAIQDLVLTQDIKQGTIAAA